MHLYKESLNELCDLVTTTFKLSSFFINPVGEVVYEKIYNQIFNPIYNNEKQRLFNAIGFNPNRCFDFPVIRSTEFSENYIMVSLIHEDSFLGTVIIGPSLSTRLSDSKLNGLVNDTQAFFDKRQVFGFYQSSSVLKLKELIDIATMAFYLFNRVLLPAETVLNKNTELFTIHIEKNEPIIIDFSENLQQKIFHHDPLVEKELLNIIKEGRVTALKDFFKFMSEEEAGVLSKSSFIRSSKNQIIILITLVTRSSIEGGVNPELAFTLSDTYIQRLEELTKLEEIKRLTGEVLYTFTKKVQEVKDEQYSKTITMCKNYIYNHIYENINHNDIAEAVKISPGYLSALFKKEVGISVKEYIHQIKIDEAKKLLSYSSTPLSDICSFLNFSDQSYFTKVFKKYTSLTPKVYRERHHLIEHRT